MQLSKGKVVVILAAVMLLGAATTFAQQPSFQSGALPRVVRGEGLTETLGEISLTNPTAAGTITLQPGSSITVLFSAPISATPADRSKILTCTPACGGLVVNPPSGNQLTIALPSTAAAVTFNANQGITISQIRANVSAYGDQATVTAFLSGSSPNPATFPITFTNPSVTVAVVDEPSATATLAAGANVLTCAPAASTPVITIKESADNPAAFTAAAQEGTAGAGFTPDIVITNGTVFSVTVSGVPSGATLGTPTTAGSDATLTTTVSAITTSGGDRTFTVSFTGTDTAAVETLKVNLPFTFTTLSSALAPITVSAVKLGPVSTTATTIVRFADNNLVSGTVITFVDCVTNLLFPWLLGGVGGYDTGIAFANTTSDAALGATNGSAVPQAGPCTVTFMNAADGTVAGTASTASIPSGGTGTMIVSAAMPGFVGHAFAVCQFLNAHAFAFMSDSVGRVNPNVSQGYLALIIPTTVAGGFNRAASGGESLGQ